MCVDILSVLTVLAVYCIKIITFSNILQIIDLRPFLFNFLYKKHIYVSFSEIVKENRESRTCSELKKIEDILIY